MRFLTAWVRSHFPSGQTVLGFFGIACLVFWASYGLAYLGHYSDKYNLSAESLLWEVVNWAGWWWWGIPMITSAVGLWYMARLDAPRTRSGITIRMFLYVGFLCLFFSWANTALGPVASILLPIGTVLWVRQSALECVEKRKQRPVPDKLVGRMLASLVNPRTS